MAYETGIVRCPRESKVETKSLTITVAYSESGGTPPDPDSFTGTAHRTLTFDRVKLTSLELNSCAGFGAFVGAMDPGKFALVADPCFPAYYALVISPHATKETPDGKRTYGDGREDDIFINVILPDYPGEDFRLGTGPSGPIRNPYLRSNMINPAIGWRTVNDDKWVNVAATIHTEVNGSVDANAEQSVVFGPGPFFRDDGDLGSNLKFRGITWPLVIVAASMGESPAIGYYFDLGNPEGTDDALKLLSSIEITKQGNGFRFGFVGDLGAKAIEPITYHHDELKSNTGNLDAPQMHIQVVTEVRGGGIVLFTDAVYDLTKDNVIKGDLSGTKSYDIEDGDFEGTVNLEVSTS